MVLKTREANAVDIDPERFESLMSKLNSYL
jgi:hypothetical protein